MATAIEQDEAGRAPSLAWPVLPPWQERNLAQLAATRGDLPHALLLHGPRGIGKHALALHLAQALLCEARAAGGLACGTCAGCHYVLAGQHPDLMRLELLALDAETGEATSLDMIAIERVRAMIDFVQLSSHRHRGKVAVIAPAERMNPAAANALLKTLEEPPAGTYLLLVSDQPARLPPTIVSRCRKVPLGHPDAADAERWLSAQGIDDATLVLAQAGGAPLAALALAEPAIQAERRTWLTALAQPDRLSVIDVASRIEQGGRDERKARLARAVDWLLSWCADLARVASGARPACNPDYADPLFALSSRVARLPLFRYHRAVLDQRALLAHPLQPRLVAESLLLDYRALFDRNP